MKDKNKYRKHLFYGEIHFATLDFRLNGPMIGCLIQVYLNGDQYDDAWWANDLSHAKTGLNIFVAVIPKEGFMLKEGWAGASQVSFGMKMIKILSFSVMQLNVISLITDW